MHLSLNFSFCYHLHIKNLHNTNILNQSREIATLFLLGKLEYFGFLFFVFFYLILPLDNLYAFHIHLKYPFSVTKNALLQKNLKKIFFYSFFNSQFDG